MSPAQIQTQRAAGIVLAGGLSRRLGGGDKALLPLGGKPMLTHVIDRISAQITPVALNANGDPNRLARFGLPIIADTIDGYAGPLAGVLAGMEWAQSLGNGFTHIVTVPGDTPFFPGDLVARFLDTNDDAADKTVIASANGARHPVFGLWPIALKDDLTTWIKGGNFKVQAFVARHDHALADFPVKPGHDPFFNINTPQDLALAQDMLGGGAT